MALFLLGWTDEKLISHFLELGVVVKAEENLYIFKYDQLLCLKWPDHIRECRYYLSSYLIRSSQTNVQKNRAVVFYLHDSEIIGMFFRVPLTNSSTNMKADAQFKMRRNSIRFVPRCKLLKR